MQTPVLIDIVLFGSGASYKDELKFINELKITNNSDVFRINNVSEIPLEIIQDEEWENLKSRLLKLVEENATVDCATLCFVNFPFEDRYFRKSLRKNIAVITFSQTREIYKEAGFLIEKFIIRHLYKSAIRYLLNGDNRNKTVKLSHEQTRGCLYDFCRHKQDVVLSANIMRPLCADCEAQLNQAILPDGFVSLFKKEFLQIAIKDYIVGTSDPNKKSGGEMSIAKM